MQFLQDHWHCILPAAGIFIGLFFMGRDKRKGKDHATKKSKDKRVP